MIQVERSNFCISETLRFNDGDLQLLDFPDFNFQRSASARAGLDQKFPFSNGEVIAERFEITAILGGGGYGTVYEAKDLENFEKKVVIKFLIPSMDKHAEEAEDLFFLGQKLGRRLSFGYYPETVAAGNHGPWPYTIYEKIEGKSLQDIMETLNRPLPEAFLVKAAIHICYALQSMHNSGVIHGDIKPSNIILTHTGKIVLIDSDLFYYLHGYDRIREEGRSGALLGTIGFIAPEVIVGSIPTRESDIYGLGSTLYELLTGRNFHEAEYYDEVIYSQLSKEPPSLKFKDNTSISPFEAVIHTAIRLDPSERFSSAAEMRIAIESACLNS